MHEGVEPGLDKDDAAHQLMEVDVVVEREDGGEAQNNLIFNPRPSARRHLGS